MSPPPAYTAVPTPTGGLVSVTVASQAASAIRRAGFQPNPGNIRMVLRAQRAVCEIPPTEQDWWDQLVRCCPLRRRARKLRASDPRRDGWRQR